MKTVLHIGMQKTGSTALQGCLLASQTYLAGRGLLYPRNPPGCKFNNHRLLLFGFVPHWRMPRHIRRYDRYSEASQADDYAEFLAHLRRQVETLRPSALVLSTESLFRRITPAGGRSLRKALGDLADDLTIAAYVRRPSEFFLSNLQQRLKHAHSIGRIRVPRPHLVLDRYAAAFGEGRLVPRVYHRRLLRDGDIITDFLAAYLPDVDVDRQRLKPGRNSNDTVSGEAMDVMRRYRLAFHRRDDNVITRDSVELIRELRRADAAVGAGRPRLRPEIADLIDYARSDPLVLRDRWGLAFPDFDYRRLERRFRPRLPDRLALRPWTRWRLEALITVDPRLRAGILDHVAASAWAAADPARGAWLNALCSA
jgi:hypothetical protein